MALLDEKGNELPGCGFAESIPITRDAVRAPVTWKSRASLKPLAGQTGATASSRRSGGLTNDPPGKPVAFK